MTKKITSLAVFALAISAVSAQYTIPGLQEGEKQVEESTVPVYEVMLPLSEDVGKMWSDFVKDEADVKVSEKKGLWKSNAFPVPGSDKEAVLQSWFTPKNDSTYMQVNMALGTNIYTNQSGFETENQFLLSLLADFDYEVRSVYFKERIKEIKKKRKEMKRGAKRLSGYVKDNKKAMKEAAKEAEENPDKKNQLLGKVKDLENKNEEIQSDIEKKKMEMKALSELEKQMEKNFKRIESEHEE